MTNVNLAGIAIKHGAKAVNNSELSAAEQAFKSGGTPRNQVDAAREVAGRNLQYVSHFGTRQQERAWKKILAKREKTTFPYAETICPGHVAWGVSSCFCGNCGMYVEGLK